MSNNTTQRRRRGRPKGSKNKRRQRTDELIDAFHAEFVEGTTADASSSSSTTAAATRGRQTTTRTTRATRATRATRSTNDTEPTHTTDEINRHERSTTASANSTRTNQGTQNNNLETAEEERVDFAELAHDNELEEQYVPADLQDVMLVGELGEYEEMRETVEGRVNAAEAFYQREINELRRRCISDSSRATYTNANVAFINYFARLEHNDEYNGFRPLRATWLAQLNQFSLENDKERKKWIKQKMDARDMDINDPPIDFETFKPGHFVLYLMACSDKNGKRLSKSAYYSKRAGLFHLYRMYNVVQSNEFQRELTTIFKGFLRTVAEEVQNGNGRITTGKIPLPFPLYCEIAGWMQNDVEPGGKFAHLFFVLSWNLACRSSNTKSIHYHHLSWLNDALQIYFAHMKNDQTGERPRDPRHTYANPYDPRICPILSLITYLLVFPPDPSTGSELFPGTDQYSRFSKYLRNLLDSKREYIMINYGLDVDDIGAHSSRKGASTYMTSGCVGGPMQQAVNIRCGWRMAGVTDTYCRYEQAGDQYCGRVVTGLPLFSFRFGVLPPKFKLDAEGEERVTRLIRTLFPDLPTELWLIVRYGLASLALRESWLRERLNSNDCLLESSIFWNPDYLFVKDKVEIELGVGDDDLEVDQIDTCSNRVTGIPSHVVLLASQRSLVLQQRELIASNARIPEMIEECIQNSGVANNQNDLRAAVAELHDIGGNLVRQLQNMTVSTTDRTDGDGDGDVGGTTTDEPAPPETRQRTRITLHLNGGELSRLNPEFVFPKKSNLRDIFLRFHVRDDAHDIPALKHIDSKSLSHITRGKQTLCDLRFLMGVFESIAVEKGATTANLSTQEEAASMFERLKAEVYKYEVKSTRKETLRWATWVQKCRKGKAACTRLRAWMA